MGTHIIQRGQQQKTGVDCLPPRKEDPLHALRQTITMDDFDDWVSDLEEGEQPKACAIDDPDCEACGS